MDENAHLRANIEELEKTLAEKDEESKLLRSQYEQVVNELESQRVTLEELEAARDKLVEEDNKAEEEERYRRGNLVECVCSQDTIRRLVFDLLSNKNKMLIQP